VFDHNWKKESDALRLAALAETFDTVTDSGLLHVFSDQDMELLIRGVHAVLRPAGLYWLMCFSEHATFPGPRRLTQQHIATLFKDGWQIRSIEHARFEVWGGLNYCSTVFAPTGIPHAKLRPI
jgi:cyclopropane fatty-acyl-phospholipid synthase-like methyltransferase